MASCGFVKKDLENIVEWMPSKISIPNSKGLFNVWSYAEGPVVQTIQNKFEGKEISSDGRFLPLLAPGFTFMLLDNKVTGFFDSPVQSQRGRHDKTAVRNPS